MIRKLAFVLFLLAGHALAETAAFDPATNVLTVPSVQIDTKLYSATQVALPANGKWSVVGIGAADAVPTTDTAVFDLNTQVLTVPSLRVGPRLFSTTQVALPADGQWAAVSIGQEKAASTTTTLAVTPTSITGKVGETVKFNITGGSPPYVVSSNTYNVAFVGSAYSSSKTYYSTSSVGSVPQAEATVIFSGEGTAQIQVRDADGTVVAVPASTTASSSTTAADGEVCWEIPPSTYSGTPYYYYGVNYGINYAGTRSPFAISPATITASAHESLTLAVGGGTPPYSIISTRSTIATASLVPGANRCQATATISTLAAGTVMIIATDGVGKQVTASITVTVNDVKITPFAVSPATVTTRMGEPIMINIVGGKPPYRVSSSREFVAYPDSGTYNSTTPSSDAPRAEAMLRTNSSGDATITVSDADGSQKTVAVTVSALPFGVSPAAATARSGEPVKITIAGGRPPYLLSTSNSFIAYPDSGIYETAMTWAEATIRTRSPGTTTITINDADGHQTTVTVTVTR